MMTAAMLVALPAALLPRAVRRIRLETALEAAGVSLRERAWLDWAKNLLDAEFKREGSKLGHSNLEASVEFLMKLQEHYFEASEK
jgi:hypothetical protein